MSKWKKLLHKQNTRHFAWPEGWDPAEHIAEQLECAPERVREHLSPSIRSGEVEVKSFTIWDSETGRKVVKTGFRIAGKSQGTAAKSQAPAQKSQGSSAKSQGRPDRWPFSEGARVTSLGRTAVGTVRNGRIHWESGIVTTPTSNSTKKKLRLAK